MDIFPAIDLQSGRCVRLTRGDFATAKTYESDPVLQAQRFAAEGARWLHIVDLDGARDGVSHQIDVIARVAKAVPLDLQVGGGIRDALAIEKLFDCGVKRAIVGSLAADNPDLVRGWLEHFGPQCIVLAFDVRFNQSGEPEVLTQGWQKGSGRSLWQMLECYSGSGLEIILCTDIDRDGMMAGSNASLYAALRERWPSLAVLASGGVRDMAELIALKASGVAGVIIGKALYENRIDLADAIRQATDAR